MVIMIAACAAERELPDAASNGVHPRGFVDEDSANFHGKQMASFGYDLALCAGCHGEDFSGGAAGVTCLP